MIDAIEGGSPEYHNVLAVRLTGVLDEPALDQALIRLVTRHDVMRTCFPSRGGEPFQLIADPQQFHVTRADLRDLAESERAKHATRLLGDEQLQPYDLESGPLVRFLLVRLDSDSHVLAIAMHHVICDAGSFDVILHELDAGYRAALAGDLEPVEPLEVQYADYALWQRALEVGGAWEGQRGFWEARLQGMTGDLPGLCDLEPYGNSLASPGRTIQREIDRATVIRLLRLTESFTVTPFMIVAATFAASLAAYAPNGADSVIVGVPFDARLERHLRPLVGMFINTLPIPLGVAAPSFRTLFENARTRLLEAYGNADIPYDAIVRAVAPARTGNSLIQTMCQLQHASVHTAHIGDLVATPFPAVSQPAKFPLTLSGSLREDQLTCEFNYATDRLSAERAEGVATTFADLLAEGVADPYRPVRRAIASPRGLTTTPSSVDRTNPTPDISPVDERGVAPELDGLVRRIFAETLGRPSVAADADFFALGGHSLLAIKLMRRINDAVPKKLPVNLVFRRPTPRALAAAIAASEHDRAGSHGDTAGFAADAWLPPDVKPNGERRREQDVIHDFVLLTGATGFLGAHVLAALLEQTESSVVCLVRPTSDTPSGRERVRNALERNRLWRDDWNSRIDVIEGDLSARRFGLGEAGFARLALGVDAIYHVGADVNIAAEYERLRPSNVDGTIEGLRLACEAGGIPFFFVSTISTLAGGPTDPDPLPEDWISDPRSLVANGYVYSKWVAERLVGIAAERGLPTMTFRPSRIAGSTLTGATAPRDAFWHYVRACFELGAEPADAEISVNLVPVDYVANAIVALSQRPARGQLYNIQADTETQLSSVMERSRLKGYAIGEADYGTWLTQAEILTSGATESSESVAVVTLLGAVADAGGGASSRGTSDSCLRRDAAAIGLESPRVDDAAIDRTLEFLHAAGFLPDAEPVATTDDSEPRAIGAQPTDVLAMIHRAAGLHPNACALREGGTAVSYRELVSAARAVGDWLQSRGIGAGDRVGISLDLAPDLITTILGILSVNASFVVFSPEDDSRRMTDAARDLALSFVIGPDELRSELPDFEPKSTNSATIVPSSTVPCGLPAYLMLTSGSTGRPKAVQVSRKALAQYIQWSVSRYLDPHSRNGCPLFTPLTVDLTLTSVFAPLAAGRPVEIVPDGIDGVAELLARGAAYDFLKCTPSHLFLLGARLDELGLRGSVRCLVVGGEALKRDPVDHWRALSPTTRIVNEYGPTEATVGCCVHELAPTAAIPDVVPIGRAIPGTSLDVLDGDFDEQTGVATGELAISGEALADGYIGRGDLTAASFLPGPDGTRRYPTGDLVRRDADGVFHFLGRRDDQLKIRGYRIEPAELEAVIKRCPGVAECAATSWERAVDDQRLVVFIASDGTPRDGLAARLLEVVRAELPQQFTPAHVFCVDRLPYTASGKLRRRGLAGAYLDSVIANGEAVGPGLGTVFDLLHGAMAGT
jgi:amino acid adenylation domain-containing protein/thioester reductase-like protein